MVLFGDRFYEQYNGVREKEKCYLVGLARKRRESRANKARISAADEDDEDDSEDDEVERKEVSGAGKG